MAARATQTLHDYLCGAAGSDILCTALCSRCLVFTAMVLFTIWRLSGT